ncbi:MAG: hypothetical protein M1812_005660, partial [Candelaria pacifica]
MPPKTKHKSKKGKEKPPAAIDSEDRQASQPLLVMTSKPAAPDPQRSVFPFQKLPPELRNRVYRYVFVSDRYIGGRKDSGRAFFRSARGFLNLNFQLSCRQIRQESAHIFYVENGFEFFYASTLVRFLQRIGKQNRKLIKTLRFNHVYNGFIVRRALKLVLTCSNLKDLDIRMMVFCFDNGGNTWAAAPILNALRVIKGLQKAQLAEPRCVVDCIDTSLSLDSLNPRDWPFISDEVDY